MDNPVHLWWAFLAVVSLVNIGLWIQTAKKEGAPAVSRSTLWLVRLSGVYVFVCAFRSFLPRADVQKICLFDTWFSNVFVGRSVATVAELCFVIQWFIVVNLLARTTKLKSIELISWLIVPLIVIAECCSWFAVITTNYLGNTFEESLWAVTYSLIGVCLIFLYSSFGATLKRAVILTIMGIILYVAFMTNVDVPMYFHRWQADTLSSKPYLGFAQGIHQLLTDWHQTDSFQAWKHEIPWMSFYFSFAVWGSIALCYVPRVLGADATSGELRQRR